MGRIKARAWMRRVSFMHCLSLESFTNKKLDPILFMAAVFCGLLLPTEFMDVNKNEDVLICL